MKLLRAATVIMVFAAFCTPAVAENSETSRKFYYPNTEALGEKEMRVVSLGTGTPNFRHSQASASWLVELGNGDKFLFDVGTGSIANLAALEIPYTYLEHGEDYVDPDLAFWTLNETKHWISKTAIVCPDKVREQAEHVQTLMMNYNIPAKIFDNRSDALVWLGGSPEADFQQASNH